MEDKSEYVNYKGEPTTPPKKGEKQVLFMRKKYIYINGEKINMSYYVKRAYKVK